MFLLGAAVGEDAGLPVREISAGERRALSYDKLGRLTQVTPEAVLGEATTSLVHSNPAGANAEVKIREVHSGTQLAERTITFDDFGRIRQTDILRPLPGGGTGVSRTEIDYHSSGVQRSATVAHGPNLFPPGQPAAATLTNKVDPQGKPTKVTAPDGTVTESVYLGERRVKTVRQVWLAETQQMLGHASPETTQVYTRVAIGKLKAIHQATNPGARLRRQKKGEVPAEVEPMMPAELLAEIEAENQEEGVE